MWKAPDWNSCRMVPNGDVLGSSAMKHGQSAVKYVLGQSEIARLTCERTRSSISCAWQLVAVLVKRLHQSRVFREPLGLLQNLSQACGHPRLP